MLLAAELINPSSLDKWRERGYLAEKDCVKCDKCKMLYPDDEYQILFDNQKLGYFYFTYEGDMGLYQVCHDCLFKKIKKIANGEELQLIILDEKNEHVCKFYPEETYDDESDDDFIDFSDFPFGDE